MHIANQYLVAPDSTLPSGTPLASRKATVWDNHTDAVNECERCVHQPTGLDRWVVYQAVTLVSRRERPTEVCDIDDDGEVTCPGSV